MIVAGPWLFLLGCALFKWVMNDRPLPPLSHLAGLGSLALLLPFAWNQVFSALALGSLTSLVMLVVAAWETLVLRERGAV